MRKEGLHIPSAWIAIAMQAFALLFFAGVGWNRLANNEDRVAAVVEDHKKLAEKVDTNSNNTRDKLEDIKLTISEIKGTLRLILERLSVPNPIRQ